MSPRGGDGRRGLRAACSHGFPFLLRDEASGLVLFMGRVSDPSAG